MNNAQLNYLRLRAETAASARQTRGLSGLRCTAVRRTFACVDSLRFAALGRLSYSQYQAAQRWEILNGADRLSREDPPAPIPFPEPE